MIPVIRKPEMTKKISTPTKPPKTRGASKWNPITDKTASARKAMACIGDAEIAVFRVRPQAVGLEILLAMMADRDALFGARLRFCNGPRALGPDRFSRRGFRGGFARG